jgi:hypothetical protein
MIAERNLGRESYRGLLQTAERIIDMDAAAHDVEMHLSKVSKYCNSRILDRKAKNTKEFWERMEERGNLSSYILFSSFHMERKGD